MTPAVILTGIYRAHCEATYFNVVRVSDDPVVGWAMRMATQEADAQISSCPLQGSAGTRSTRGRCCRCG